MNDLLLMFAYLTGTVDASGLPLGAQRAHYIVEVYGQRVDLASEGGPWKLVIHPGIEGRIRLANPDGTLANPGIDSGAISFGVEARPVPLAVRADFDGNGVVGISDFGMLIQAWGKCRKDMEEVPCS